MINQIRFFKVFIKTFMFKILQLIKNRNLTVYYVGIRKFIKTTN